MEVPKLNLPSGRKTVTRFQTDTLKDNEKAHQNWLRRKERRSRHHDDERKSEVPKREPSFTLSVAGAWRGPIEVSCDAIVRDLKQAIMEKSGVHYTYQHLSLRQGRKGSFETTVLSDNYSSLRSYGVKSRCRILFINAKPDEDARLLRLKRLREKKEKRKHETLKAKLERQKRRAQRAQQLSDWRLDAQGNLLRKGKVVYPNGAVYDGEWKNQKRHGNGVLVDVNGDRYEGMFEEGIPNGFGKRVYAFVMIDHELVKGKRSYEGHWKDGLYDGSGKYVVGNGETYVGEFQNGMYHGRGRYEYLDGRIYDGDFARGHRSGFGKMIYPNGDVYEGEWKMDNYEGRGKLVLRRAGQMEGFFRMGALHGQGTRTYVMLERSRRWSTKHKNVTLSLSPLSLSLFSHTYTVTLFRFASLDSLNTRTIRYADGRVFEGTFYHGERKKGKMTITLEEWYEGEWQNGWMHGQGFMKWRNGNSYRGSWVKGMPWGKGKLTFSDGGYYDGEFKSMTDPNQFSHGVCYPKPDGMFHGYGTRLYVSGAIHRGMFKQGRAHGKGVYVSKQMRYEGEFQDGKKHGQGTCYYFPDDPETCTRFTCPAGFCHRVTRDEVEIADTPVSTVSASIRMLERIFRYDPTTTCIYRGEWRDDLFHGRGIYHCCDGRKYEGQYVRGKRQGYGTQSLVPKSQKGDPKRLHCGGQSGLYRPYVYTGQWNLNRPCGHGKTKFAPNYQEVNGIHDETLSVQGIAKVEWPSTGKTRRARYQNGWRISWIGDDVDLSATNRLIWSRTILNQSEQLRRRSSIGERRRRRCSSSSHVDEKRKKEEVVVDDSKEDDDFVKLSLPPGFGGNDEQEEVELSLPPGFGPPPTKETTTAEVIPITNNTADDWILSEPMGIEIVSSPRLPPSLFERPPGF